MKHKSHGAIRTHDEKSFLLIMGNTNGGSVMAVGTEDNVAGTVMG